MVAFDFEGVALGHVGEKNSWPNGFGTLVGRGLVPLVALAIFAVLAAISNSIPIRLFTLAIAIIVAAGAGWLGSDNVDTHFLDRLCRHMLAGPVASRGGDTDWQPIRSSITCRARSASK